MIGKLKWLVGFGAGYVLGARAGRERYDQIAGKAQEMWSDPRVQAKADQAQQLVKEKADQAQQVVKEKVGEKTSGNGSRLGFACRVRRERSQRDHPVADQLRLRLPLWHRRCEVVVSQTTEPAARSALPRLPPAMSPRPASWSLGSPTRCPSWCATSSAWHSSR